MPELGVHAARESQRRRIRRDVARWCGTRPTQRFQHGLRLADPARTQFRDAAGATLPISPDRGAAADNVTVNVKPGAVAVASVRYVSSDVFTMGRCFDTRRLGLAVARHGALVWTPFPARICRPRSGAGVARKPFTTAMDPLPRASRCSKVSRRRPSAAILRNA